MSTKSGNGSVARTLLGTLLLLMFTMAGISAMAITFTQRVEASAALPQTSCGGACNPAACSQSIGVICDCIGSSCTPTHE